MNKKLLLADGTEFYGQAFGAMEDAFGQVIFVTSMTGYQELLTDPALLGYLVVMTYPLIGNYGINRDDYEALQPYLSGFIVREHAKDPCNFRMNKNLEDYLKKMKVPGLFGVDTRQLTRHIRQHGSMKAAILEAEVCKKEGLARIDEYCYENNPLALTSTKNIYQIPASGKRVVLIDYGTKSSIIRSFSDRGYHLTVVPYDTSAADVLELNPDAVVLAGGAGDPNHFTGAIENVKEMMGKVPLFGISMGQYLLALAAGAKVVPMKYGHHGSAPVKELASGKILMTAQNHHYSVCADSLTGTGLEITHISVNDHNVQGIRHTKAKALAVQFQPESSADGATVFTAFQQMLAD